MLTSIFNTHNERYCVIRYNNNHSSKTITRWMNWIHTFGTISNRIFIEYLYLYEQRNKNTKIQKKKKGNETLRTIRTTRTSNIKSSRRNEKWESIDSIVCYEIVCYTASKLFFDFVNLLSRRLYIFNFLASLSHLLLPFFLLLVQFCFVFWNLVSYFTTVDT